MGAPQGRTGGEGVTYDYVEVPSFQLTVYKHREVRPEWYERGMVYQIFPDRYARDEHWHERTLAELEKPRKGIQRRMVEDWNEPPVRTRAEDGSIKTWDFYGGSLKGIQEDLPRIAELGFTAIYLNPIFEADKQPPLRHRRLHQDRPDSGHRAGLYRAVPGSREARHFHYSGRRVQPHGRRLDLFQPLWQLPRCGRLAERGFTVARRVYFHEDGSYDCWWGVGNMPAINEKSELVREKLLGKDGVIRKWLRAGAHGWRLDVADELSDDFLAEIKKAVLAEKPDALLLGEVWGRRLQQDQLRPSAPLPAGLRAGLRNGLPLPRHGHRLFDGLQERLSGGRGHRDPARELSERGPVLRAQSAVEPRPSAHHLGARRRSRRVAAARVRAQQMALG